MTNYGETHIEELIEEYSMLAKDPLVAAYLNVREELRNREQSDYIRKPEREFYKKACGYKFTIELPFDELVITRDKARIRHHDYSFVYEEPGGVVWDTCLSMCGYSREEVVEMIENRISLLESEGGDD